MDEPLVPVRKQLGLKKVGFSIDYLVPVTNPGLKPLWTGSKGLFFLLVHGHQLVWSCTRWVKFVARDISRWHLHVTELHTWLGSCNLLNLRTKQIKAYICAGSSSAGRRRYPGSICCSTRNELCLPLQNGMLPGLMLMWHDWICGYVMEGQSQNICAVNGDWKCS
jgi:hypothetical protein